MDVQIVRTGLISYQAQCLLHLSGVDAIISTVAQPIGGACFSEFRYMLGELTQILVSLGIQPCWENTGAAQELLRLHQETQADFLVSIQPQVFLLPRQGNKSSVGEYTP